MRALSRLLQRWFFGEELVPNPPAPIKEPNLEFLEAEDR